MKIRDEDMKAAQEALGDPRVGITLGMADVEQQVRDSDGALILENGEGALVTSDKMTRVALLVPKELEEEQEMPRAMVFLAAMLVRFDRDPEFVDEQIAWFRGGAL